MCPVLNFMETGVDLLMPGTKYATEFDLQGGPSVAVPQEARMSPDWFPVFFNCRHCVACESLRLRTYYWRCWRALPNSSVGSECFRAYTHVSRLVT